MLNTTFKNLGSIGMSDSKFWIILTSRSGKTAAAVQEQLELPANVVLSTKDQKHSEIMDTLRAMDPTNVIITAMGYMRIIDADICEKFEIYNLHPGDIAKYPWLKGKDPIEKYFERRGGLSVGLNHTLGSVIHRVVPEVDAGEIIRRKSYLAYSVENAYNVSFDINVSMWVEVLKDKLWQE